MTTSLIFDKVENFSNELLARLNSTGIRLDHNDQRFPWNDLVFIGDNYRRAHLNIVDAREEKNLLMMHCCIFPHINDPSPIFGLDIIAGPSRISGAFHDFSSAGNPDHFMIKWFDQRATDLNWKKPRQLPDWALKIFSPAMIAAGAMNSETEINQLISVSLINLEYYLDNVGATMRPGKNYTAEQNRYCHYQKQNPHNPRVMQSLGLSEDDALSYVEEVMFPEIR